MGCESQTPSAISWVHGKTWLPAKAWFLDVTTEYPKKMGKELSESTNLVIFLGAFESLILWPSSPHWAQGLTRGL